MTKTGVSEFDRVWEERYQNPAYRNLYPWSSVVQFVFRYHPRDRAPADTSIVEVGCGNGANLWFAAREGFQTAGIDGSETAIAFAREWFQREKLPHDFYVRDFATLPFADDSFDLAIDRSALSFTGIQTVTSAISEIHRVLRRGGKFLFTPYSDRCSSYDGVPDADGCYRRVSLGSIRPGAQVRFYSLTDIRVTLSQGWEIKALEHHERTDFLTRDRIVHAEWLVVAEKV